MSQFHRLVETEIPRLRRYARALTRRADRADDLVQETLVRAIAKSHLWQAGNDIRASPLTILHNQHENMVRCWTPGQATARIEPALTSLAPITDPTPPPQLRD